MGSSHKSETFMSYFAIYQLYVSIYMVNLGANSSSCQTTSIDERNLMIAFKILNMYISEMFLLPFISKQIINIKNISLLVLLVLNYTTMLVFGIRIHFLRC